MLIFSPHFYSIYFQVVQACIFKVDCEVLGKKLKLSDLGPYFKKILFEARKVAESAT